MGRPKKLADLDDTAQQMVVRAYLLGNRSFVISKALNRYLEEKGEKADISVKNVERWTKSKSFQNMLRTAQEQRQKQISNISYDVEKELVVTAEKLKDEAPKNPKLWTPFIKTNELLAKIRGQYSDGTTQLIDNRQVNIAIDSAAFDLIKDDPEKLKALKAKLQEMKNASDRQQGD